MPEATVTENVTEFDSLPAIAIAHEGWDTFRNLAARLTDFGVTFALTDGGQVEGFLAGIADETEDAVARILFHPADPATGEATTSLGSLPVSFVRTIYVW